MQIKITSNFKIIEEQLTISRKKIMMGVMAEKIICIPNRKKSMMNLMQSRLENIMKSKVIKNPTN